jgi:rare lipoprotein A
MIVKRLFFIALFASLLLPYVATIQLYAQNVGDVSYGNASWYGPRFHGRPTASGEPFNRFALTAAHPTYPFGSLVKVTLLESNRHVVVRINDRGPFVPDRIIDISEQAAKIIGLSEMGVGQVKLELIQLPRMASASPASNTNPPPRTNPNPPESSPEPSQQMAHPSEGLVTYKIQFGAFENVAYAQNLRAELLKKQISTRIFQTELHGKTIYKVLSSENYDNEAHGRARVETLNSQRIICFLLFVRMNDTP